MTDYKIISGEDIAELTANIKTDMASGWLAIGNVTIGDNGVFYQSMYK